MKNWYVSILLGIIAIGALIAAYFAMPDSPLFLVKRWEEKLFSNVARNPNNEISYDLFLLSRRLDELKNVTKQNEQDLFVPTALRYATLAGEITNISLENEKIKSREIANRFNADKKQILGLLKGRSGDIWKFVNDDSNYLDIYLRKLQS